MKKFKKGDITKDGAKVIYVNPDIQTRKGFKVKQSVLYLGKEYKIHSFPREKDMVNLRKHKKDGTMDLRARALTIKISKITKI
jgi:hypothetical protein